jgi:hypothetical protein
MDAHPRATNFTKFSRYLISEICEKLIRIKKERNFSCNLFVQKSN